MIARRLHLGGNETNGVIQNLLSGRVGRHLFLMNATNVNLTVPRDAASSLVTDHPSDNSVGRLRVKDRARFDF